MAWRVRHTGKAMDTYTADIGEEAAMLGISSEGGIRKKVFIVESIIKSLFHKGKVNHEVARIIRGIIRPRVPYRMAPIATSTIIIASFLFDTYTPSASYYEPTIPLYNSPYSAFQGLL